MRVLDASVFIRGHEVDGPTATVGAVRDELQPENRYQFDAREGAGMSLYVPDERTLREVRTAARASGDHRELSETDERVLATAVDLDATLVTDDYAMQNVARRLGLEVEAIGREGITAERAWQFQCRGCGRTFDEDPGRCPVCGSDCSRKNPR